MAIVHWRPFRSISHWEPFGEIDTLRKEMDSLFEQFLLGSRQGSNGLTYMPSAEIDETDTEIHLKLEVPGMKADDLEIEVTDESVSITGERQSEHHSELGDRLHSEFHYGKFERVVPLPSRITRDKVTAEYENGILMLTLPKSDDQPQQAVKVKID